LGRVLFRVLPALLTGVACGLLIFWHASSAPLFGERLILDGGLPCWSYPTYTQDSRGNLAFLDGKRTVLLVALPPARLDKRAFFSCVWGSVASNRLGDTVKLRLSARSDNLVELHGLKHRVIVVQEGDQPLSTDLPPGEAARLFAELSKTHSASSMLDAIRRLSHDPAIAGLFISTEDRNSATARCSMSRPGE
jgi:hypothetical protein